MLAFTNFCVFSCHWRRRCNKGHSVVISNHTARWIPHTGPLTLGTGHFILFSFFFCWAPQSQPVHPHSCTVSNWEALHHLGTPAKTQFKISTSNLEILNTAVTMPRPQPFDLWRGTSQCVCSRSWGSITARGGSSSRAREKVSWQCNQSRAEWINRRATQIDTPSCPELLHPPPALMLPQDTFSLPVMSPWQPINKHIQVTSMHVTQLLSHQVLIKNTGHLVLANCKEKSLQMQWGQCDDMNHHGWVDSKAGWCTVDEEEQDTASLARNLYLSSTTWPGWLRCAYLGFHPSGDPSTWLHQTASKCRGWS